MMRRRDLLALGGAAAAWGALGNGAARAADELLAMTMRPQNWATPTEYFDRLITPTDVFFVRSHFGPPALKATRKLRVEGLVDAPLVLGADDLKVFEPASVTCVVQCAGNGRALAQPRVPGVQWVHGAMGQAEFRGVRLADVLKKAGLRAGAAHLRVVGADLAPKPTVPRFIRSIPVERALDPTTLVATHMNGAPLTLLHGAPLRLIVPGWTGNHFVKWLTEIRVQKEEAEGFYLQTAYRLPTRPVEPGGTVAPADTRPVTTFPVKSIIGRPTDGARAPLGPQEVVGVAFSGAAPIAKVEVSTDGGTTWNAAALEGVAAPARWQVFRYRFDARAPGTLRAMARATDGRGETQPERAVWNPSGYLWNGWHAVTWTVHA
jgi:DMSO/TMAO reductase YedYZ molybdopterin-dependent catalytic subunit